MNNDTDVFVSTTEVEAYYWGGSYWKGPFVHFSPPTQGQPGGRSLSPRLSVWESELNIELPNKCYATCEGDNPCLAGQTCRSTFDAKYCCPQGATKTKDCFDIASDVNECDNSAACGSNMSCTNTIGSFKCACLSGYKLNSDGTSCSDVDECADDSHSCTSGEQCFNTAGSFTCTCKTGFATNATSKDCEDVNECSTNPHACHALAICTNSAGSYSCACKTGFTGDGKQCEDTDECANNACHSRASCTNTFGSFSCKCKDGYSGDGTSCSVVGNTLVTFTFEDKFAINRYNIENESLKGSKFKTDLTAPLGSTAAHG